jgi:hypothetical protein
MPRRTSRRSSIRRTRVTSTPTLIVAPGMGAPGNLGKAAQDLANGIKERAAEFSVKIPPSVHVGQGTETTATVYATAPNAYPIETGARHPLFARGPRDAPDAEKRGWGYWYPMKQILFMEEGAAKALDKAAEDWGYNTINDWLKEVDW